MFESKFVSLCCLVLLTFSIFAAEIHEAAKNGELAIVQELIQADKTVIDLEDERLFIYPPIW